VWCRFDAILLVGALLVLLAEPKRRFVQFIFLIGIGFIATSVFLILNSQVSLMQIIQDYLSHRNNSNDIQSTLNNYSTIFTMATLYFMGLESTN